MAFSNEKIGGIHGNTWPGWRPNAAYPLAELQRQLDRVGARLVVDSRHGPHVALEKLATTGLLAEEDIRHLARCGHCRRLRRETQS